MESNLHQHIENSLKEFDEKFALVVNTDPGVGPSSLQLDIKDFLLSSYISLLEKVVEGMGDEQEWEYRYKKVSAKGLRYAALKPLTDTLQTLKPPTV